MLQDYQRLALLKDPEGRSQLIGKVSAAYADKASKDPSPIERELFSSIVLDLYDQLNDKVRMDIVVRLARTDRITPALADRLAQEDIYMSELLLEHSPSISPETLLTIARNRDMDCKLAVARRTEIDSSLSDALISSNLAPVMIELLRNAGAQFSDNAVLVMAIRSTEQREILFEMADRCLLNEDFLEGLRGIIEAGCPFMSPSFRKAVLDGELNQYVEQLEARAGSTDIEIGDATYSRHEAQVNIASGDLSFQSVLSVLLQHNDKDGIVWFLSRHLNLTIEGTTNLLMSQADAALSRMLSRTGISASFYKEFLTTRDRWLGRSQRSYLDEVQRFRQLVSKYNQISVEDVRQMRELPGVEFSVQKKAANRR